MSIDSFPRQYKRIVKVSAANTRVNLFLIHPGHSGCYSYTEFCSFFENKANIYVIDHRNLFAKQPAITNINQLAHCYLTYIKAIQPVGPYVLAGWSLGGLFAYSIAQLLKNNNVMKLYLFDSILYLADYRVEALKIFDLLTYDSWNKQYQFQLLSKQQQQHLLNICYIDNKLNINYEPMYYDGEVILFKSNAAEFVADNPQKEYLNNCSKRKLSHGGWGPYTKRLIIETISSSHTNMVHGKAAKAISSYILNDLKSCASKALVSV